MLLAFDDTDGPEGGCTTHLVGAILEAIGPEHAAGPPRLVRLDPMNPYKTRGNAAVAIPLDGLGSPETTIEQAFEVIRDHARLAKGKGAGLALFEEPPDPGWYERGVRERIPIGEARRALEDVPTRTLGTGRGLIGALAAAAWRPGPQATYERIVYREPARWGSPRTVDTGSLSRVEARYPEIFDCVDDASGYPVMVPRTPCPVLYGLRATEPGHLEVACSMIESEPVARASTFVTNQASDDHIDPSKLVLLDIVGRPSALDGGHVRLPCEHPEHGPVTCMAYEPTGRLREVVRAIEPGDRVLPAGSWKQGREHPTVNLEKLLHLPASRRESARCRVCDRAMRSTGSQGPLRCPGCGDRRAPSYTAPPARWAEADASARRHLARPLALGLAEHVRAALPVPAEPVREALKTSLPRRHDEHDAPRRT